MAVTKSWTEAGAAPVAIAAGPRTKPPSDIGWLLCASLLVAAGLGMVYAAKSQGFAAAAARLREGGLVNLNTVSDPEQLAPLFESAPDRSELARNLFDAVVASRPLKNVGAVAL